MHLKSSDAVRLVFYPLRARIRRPGATLIELVVALALGTIVVALCATTLVGQRRAERTAGAALAPAVAADEAIATIVAALGRVAATDTVWARGDTAIEWRATIGAALACAAGGDSVVVPDSGAMAWWESFPDSGDVIAFAGPSGAWERHVVVAAHTRASGGACGAAQRTLRLQDAIAAGGIGPVRGMRANRLMLYHAADGSWWFGARTCDDAPPGHCSSAQPVTGPLNGPPAGLRFAFDSVSGRLRVSVNIGAGRIVRSAAVTVGQ